MTPNAMGSITLSDRDISDFKIATKPENRFIYKDLVAINTKKTGRFFIWISTISNAIFQAYTTGLDHQLIARYLDDEIIIEVKNAQIQQDYIHIVNETLDYLYQIDIKQFTFDLMLYDAYVPKSVIREINLNRLME